MPKYGGSANVAIVGKRRYITGTSDVAAQRARFLQIIILSSLALPI